MKHSQHCWKVNAARAQPCGPKTSGNKTPRGAQTSLLGRTPRMGKASRRP